MEHVTVRFPKARVVLIDGGESGMTNTILRIEEGTHTFSLNGPQNFSPPSQTLKVKDTTPVKPMEVIFAKIP